MRNNSTPLIEGKKVSKSEFKKVDKMEDVTILIINSIILIEEVQLHLLKKWI